MTEPRDSITIISVGYGSWDYLRFLAFTAEKLAESGWKEWLLIDNSPGEAQADLLRSLPRARVLPRALALPCYEKAVKYEHGYGQDYACSVNALYRSVETEYTLLLDPDVAFVRKGWDRVLVEEMEVNGFDAVGGPYNPYRWRKYQGLPSVAFLFVRTQLLKQHDFDFGSYSNNPLSRWFEYLMSHWYGYYTGRGWSKLRRSLVEGRSGHGDSNDLLGRGAEYLVGHRDRCYTERAWRKLVEGRSQDAGWRLPRLFKSAGAKTLAFDMPLEGNIDEAAAGTLVVGKRGARGYIRPGPGILRPEDKAEHIYDEFWHRGEPFATHHLASTQSQSGGGKGWLSDKTRLWSSRIMEYAGLSYKELDGYLVPEATAPGETSGEGGRS